MSQTVIGFFDNQSDAQRAIERLQSNGIGHDRVDVSRGTTAGSRDVGNLETSNTSSDPHAGETPNPVSGSTRDENSVRRDEEGRTLDPNDRNTNKFTDFFNNLFGGRDKDDDDNDETGRYSHVAQRSNSIVTVHAQSREEAETAAEILDDCGAVDVDERAGQSGYSNSGILGTGKGLARGVGGEGNRMRSRIVDRRIDDDFRLRDGF